MSTTVTRAAITADDLATRMGQLFAPVIQAKTDQDVAQTAFQDAAKGTTNAREVLMGSLADLATRFEVNDLMVKNAIDAAIGKLNDKDAQKTLATMKSELKLAMHGTVAPWFNHLVMLRDQAWTNEKASTPKGETGPLARAFARSYHVLVRCMAAIKDAEISVPTRPEDLVAFAEANDPRYDATKVAKRLEGVYDDLATIATDFPHPVLKAVLTAFSQMGEGEALAKALRAARVAKQDATHQAAVAAATAPTPDPAPAAAPNEAAPVDTGVSLDDLMGIAQPEALAA